MILTLLTYKWALITPTLKQMSWSLGQNHGAWVDNLVKHLSHEQSPHLCMISVYHLPLSFFPSSSHLSRLSATIKYLNAWINQKRKHLKLKTKILLYKHFILHVSDKNCFQVFALTRFCTKTTMNEQTKSSTTIKPCLTAAFTWQKFRGCRLSTADLFFTPLFTPHF